MPKPDGTNSLSVCLIARNEEASLPRAIKSIREVADEIVVADTGSTDKTIEVARELGATVCHFPWCDDFSAARNFAIDHAHGDWILWLDADEELLPDSGDELRRCVARRDALAFQIQRQDLQFADRLDCFTVMRQLRLFRRREDLRFIGRCHPHFEKNIWQVAAAAGLKFEDSSITFRHYGYVGEQRPAKLQRAARLLELELQERPGQFYYRVELGRTLLQLNDERGHGVLSQAAEQLFPRVHDPEPPELIVGLLLEYLLRVPAERLPHGYSRQMLHDLVKRWFSKAPHLLWLLARHAAEQGRFDEAEQVLRQLLYMGKNHSYDKTVSFDPGFIGDAAKTNLAICLVRQMRLPEARQLFQELLANPNYSSEARENITLIDQVLGHSGGGISYSFG